ncbi:MAG: hypothetical protein ABSE51_04605 [Terracidiphilus sp.]|jgi:hypothetical protein
MNMLKLWIAIVWFSGILSVAAAAQETGSQLVTPSTASVSSFEHLRLVPGNKHSFILTFDKPAPQGYEGWGKLSYIFQTAGPGRDQLDQLVYGGVVELHDGQLTYELPVKVTEDMLPGTWKLGEVAIVGPNSRKPVQIQDQDKVTLEIPQIPPLRIHIQHPDIAKAGHQFTFNISVEGYPKGLYQDCVPKLSGVLHPATPNAPPQPNAYYPIKAEVKSIILKPDQHSYDVTAKFDPDLSGGPWQGEMRLDGERDIEDPPLCSPCWEGWMHACLRSIPRLEGDVWFTFNLEAANLATPTSATVIVNPSQVELLHYEAERLKAKYEHLKQQLSAENMATNHDLLLKNVKDAMDDLKRTETAYKEKEDKGALPSYAQAIDVFFDDIRLGYDDALKSLGKDSVLLRQSGPRLVLVSSAFGGSALHLKAAQEAVLRSMLHNASAYNFLAASFGIFDIHS